MRDKTHLQSVERWADYVKKNPKWKKHHKEFIDAQFKKAYYIIKKIANSKNGGEKLKQIYNIKNEKGYPKLFSLKKSANQ
jgi:hypothetical protein